MKTLKWHKDEYLKKLKRQKSWKITGLNKLKKVSLAAYMQERKQSQK